MISPEFSTGSSIEGSQGHLSGSDFLRSRFKIDDQSYACAAGTVVTLACLGIAAAAVTEWQPLMAAVNDESWKWLVKGGTSLLTTVSAGGLIACIHDHRKTTSC